jgi:glycosyltransferase involved in cell wall biosynthesis
MRLAIITTHPIQYYAPVFKLLYERGIEIKVFYTLGEAGINKYDKDFKRTINWDIPLLEGYPYELVRNKSENPGSHHFKGIINPGLIKTLKMYKPEAILIYGWAYHSHLKLMRYFKNRIPVYFRGDSTLLDQVGGIKSGLKSIFLRWVYTHINFAFYVGTNNKAYFKNYGLNEDQLIFAPHAIDNERFAISRAPEATALREKLNIKEGDVLLLFAGKFEKKKDPLSLLEAFLNININNVHLLLVGNGNLEGVMKDKAKGNSNVHFMDFQNQAYIPVIYQACDIFCLPSKGPAETWGLAVNEAMACKKAVLVSGAAGCAVDLVFSGLNGVIFSPEEPGGLKNCLKILAGYDRKKLAIMGEKSFEIIREWSIQKQVNALLAALNEK